LKVEGWFRVVLFIVSIGLRLNHAVREALQSVIASKKKNLRLKCRSCKKKRSDGSSFFLR
jgi:hypothetical protein